MKNNNYSFEKICIEDIQSLSILHKDAWEKDHFSYYFSVKYLNNYYKNLIELNDFSIKAVDSGKIIGFIICGSKTKEAVNLFIKKYWYYIIYILIRHPKFIFEKIYGLFLRIFGKLKYAEADVRLYEIVIDNQYQNMGVGKNMLAFLENEMLSKKISSYGLSVRASNSRAEQFYIKNGFTVDCIINNSIAFTKTLKH